MEYPILNLPLDKIGDQPTHKFVELHVVDKDKENLVYPERGPFYTSIIEVKDQDGNPLKPELDWKPILHYRKATLELGQTVHRCIVIEAANVTSVEITYQAVGGIYTNSNIAFEQLLEWFITESGKVNWDDVIKPDRHKPIMHIHSVKGDLLGTQDLVEAINNVARVVVDWMDGKDFTIDEIVDLREYLDKLDAKDGNLTLTIQQISDNLVALEQRVGNVETRATDLESGLSAANDAIETNRQNIATNASGLVDANKRIDGNDNDISALQQLLNDTIDELGKLTDTVGRGDYEVVNAPGTEELVTRTRKTTYIDKMSVIDSVIKLDVNSFEKGDTIILNVPMVQSMYKTEITVKDDGLIRSLDGVDGASFFMDGNFNLELRCIGAIGDDTILQMIKIS